MKLEGTTIELRLVTDQDGRNYFQAVVMFNLDPAQAAEMARMGRQITYNLTLGNGRN